MPKQGHKHIGSRREFARHLLGLSVSAAAIGYTGATATELKTPASTDSLTLVTPPQGYRLTPHIERYYRSIRR